MKTNSKTLLALAAVATASACFAVIDGVNVLPVPPSKMAEFNAKTGGLVFPPKDAKKLVFLDARTTPGTTLSNCVKAVESLARIDCEMRKAECAGDADPWKVASAAKRAGAGGVILLYERDDAPVLTAYPEEAVSLVNVRPLYSPDLKTRNVRFIKELWRAVGFALGGYGNVMQPGSVMQPCFSIADLDALNGMKPTPQQLAALSASRSKTHVYGKGAVPYSRAAREGWAPPPTNAVQKAYYERFCDPSTRFKKDFKPKVEFKK